MQAKHHLLVNLRQVFEVLRMDMDTMQATMRGDIHDLCRHVVSPADMQDNLLIS